MISEISRCAFEAVLFEVSCPYKPGLVTPYDNGAHDDMNYQTFINSSIALIPYFENYYRIGKKNNLSDIFQKLREEGILAEKAMFNATDGVNTHKGLNFIFSIMLGSIGYLHQKDMNSNYLQLVIKEVSKPLQRDFDMVESKNKLSHGEKLYVKYGIKGIRQQAIDGFPDIFEISYPMLQKEKELSNKIILNSLFHLMTTVQDTTIIHRCGLEGIKEVQSLAKNFLSRYSFFQEFPITELQALNEYFKSKRYSPGGSADLISASILLYLLETKGLLRNS